MTQPYVLSRGAAADLRGIVRFCLPRQSRQTLILAILHERMDLIARLKERLGL